jgi:hypothetical protein
MNTFNEGDRVSHPTRGEGTVLHPYEGTGWSTVQFDSGDKYMTDTHMLSLIPRSAPFKNGDRVLHTVHGTATVTAYDAARKLVEIEPIGYGGSTVYVHPVSLTLVTESGTLVPRKYNDGDRVAHVLHRDGTVAGYSEHSGLYTVELPGNRCYYALEDQLSEPQPDPKFTLQVIMTDGSGVNTDRPLYQQEIETYLTNFPSWDNVETITVTRAKG